MILPIRGSRTRRSTRTVTVFCILSLTTRPIRCFGVLRISCASLTWLLIWPPFPSSRCARARCRASPSLAGWCWKAAASRPACAGRTAPAGGPRAPSAGPRRSFPAIHSLSWESASEHALRDDGAERELRRGESERLLGERLGDAVHLEDDLAGLDLGDEVLRIALAVAHAHFGRLGRNGLVGEDPDPDA